MMDIPRQYDSMAQQYVAAQEEFFSDDEDQARRFIKDNLPDIESKRLLDLGCGAGPDIINYEKQGAECWGIDSSLEMIRLGKERVSHPDRLSVASMDDLPFEDSSFDVVTARYSLHYLEDVSKTMKEVARVLRPGGTFIFVVGHPFHNTLKTDSKKYGAKDLVRVRLYNGKIPLTYYAQTLQDYLCPEFLQHLRVTAVKELFTMDIQKEDLPDALAVSARKHF